jgi:hypothetical protein
MIIRQNDWWDPRCERLRITLLVKITEMHMTVARQRPGKNIPEATFSTTEGHPWLGNAYSIT